MKTRVYRRRDHSLAIQNASTWILRKENELEDARNVRFNEEIGAIVRRDGYTKSGSQFSTTSKVPRGFHTAQFTTGTVKFIACNNDADTQTIVRKQNTDGTWTTIITDIPADSEVFFTDYRDEVFVSGYTIADDTPFAPYNIDKTLNVSQSRNLLFCPPPKYFAVFKGVIYAVGVKIGSTLYPDRLYKSSAPTGAFTFVQGQQSNVAVPQTFVNQVPTMTSATAPFGTASATTAVAGEEAWKAFDKTTTGLWTATAATGTLQYDFGASNAKVITYYGIIGGRSSALLTRAPKSWTFEGSNNGSTWTSIHSVVNAPVWTTLEERTYSTSNTTAYRYYRLVITLNQGAASNVDVVELKMNTSASAVKPLQLKLDSVRYVKSGMELDIYKAGKTLKLFTITVYDVDKPTNTIQFLPFGSDITSVNTTTDEITIASTTNYPTGTPIIFSATATIPAPLVAGTTYYAINTSSTTLKVATTFDNASIGQAIDITSAGTGVTTASLSYVLSNNDEIYLKDRHEVLSSLWNTDYPTPDKADFSAIQPGVDSSNVITGVTESANRLQLFTLNTSNRFDGKTTICYNKNVGCVSQRTIANIDDDWVIWLTSSGRVYARNEAGGQQEYISRGVSNKLLSKIAIADLKGASASILNGEYTVYVGLYEGEPTRAVYDFGSNTWSVDALNHKSLMYTNDTTSGFNKSYFASDNGYIYLDSDSNLDDDKPIRFEASFGRTNYGTENDKQFIGAFIYSENAVGLKIRAQVDNEYPIILGQISKNYGVIDYPTSGAGHPQNGSTIAVSIVGVADGPPQKIQMFNDYYNIVQEINGHGQKQ